MVVGLDTGTALPRMSVTPYCSPLFPSYVTGTLDPPLMDTSITIFSNEPTPVVQKS